MTDLSKLYTKTDNCRCCGRVVEYNSEGYRWGLCIDCNGAAERFILTRRENFKRKGLVKKSLATPVEGKEYT